MTLKMKLTSLIASFTLVVGLMLMGIMAVNQATVNMGGSINFTATDVYARVTGKIENAQGEYADKTLPPIEFSAENDTPDQSEWSGLNLLFDDDATPIVITVTVENLARDRQLTASLTDNTAINENLVKDLKQDGVTYTSGTTKDLDASTGEGTSTTTYVVTFSIADRNKSLPQMDFELDISLYDESETPEEPEYEILEGFKFDKNGTLLAYTESETEVVIPSSYSIVEGESVDKTLEFSSYEDFIADAMANMNAYMSMTNFTVILNGHQYGPYDTFEQFAMSEDVMIAMESATSIIFKYQEGGDQYVKGNDYQVKSIGASAFTNTNITKVTLPSGLSSIGSSAFSGCSGLTELDLSNCTSLVSIGNGAFNECSGLISIDLPSSLSSLGSSAFSYCSGLTELDLSNCTSLSSIGRSAFIYCSELTTLTLPSSLTSIGDMAFENCDKLQPSRNDDKGVKYLGNSENPYVVLWDAREITTSTYAVNENCKIIYYEAFSNCKLTSITLPSNLISIGGHAFEFCGNLKSITLPSSLTSISGSAFSACSALETIEVDKDNKVYHDEGNCIIETDTNTLVIGCQNSVIPSYISSIGDNAFSGCSDLTSITIPKGVTSIGSTAFFNSGLTSIDLSACTNLTSIGENAFNNCDGLTEVDLSNCTSLTSIGRHAFVSCANLRSIAFPYTTGWYCTTSSSAISGDPMDMSDPTQNATWLTAENGEDYYGYYFKRNA